MKIGLISLSGIQVRDRELLELGVNLPGIIERSRAIASLPNLGLLILAGMTPPYYEIKYMDVSGSSQASHLDDDFDLVAISSYSAQIREAYQIADNFRQQGAKVVMGGLHVSQLPEEAEKHCDAVMVGEGELFWTELIRDFEANQLKPIYRAGGREFDLSQAPLPAYELLAPEQYNRLTVQATRGCPFRCEFCGSSPLLSQRYKHKPIAKVLREIDCIKEIWQRPIIEFVDDNALVNRSYWKILLSELKKRQVRWFAEADISVSEDEELLQMMRSSGCVQILIGLESPILAGLDGLEQRWNWKKQKMPHYLSAIRQIQSSGIRVIGCFIVGLDGHDSKIFEEIYQFAVAAELFDIQITLPTPFPGTAFYSRLKRERRLLEPEAWDKCTLFDLNFQPKYLTVSELREGFRNLGFRLYGEEITRWRRTNFKKYLRHLESDI
jgi:radical SAM superfamily enzyme YgiQ (UPF0313 family)